MQRVEILGLVLQHRVVEVLRLDEVAALISAQRLAQQARDIRLQVLRWVVVHWPARVVKPPESRTGRRSLTSGKQRR